MSPADFLGENMPMLYMVVERYLSGPGRFTGADQVSPKGAMDAARVLITAADRCSHPGPGRYCRRGDHISRAGAELVSDQQARLVHRPHPRGRHGDPPPAGTPAACPVPTLSPGRCHRRRIIEVRHDQAGDLDLFQNQADRWKASPGLTEAQRAGIAAYGLVTLMELIGWARAAATSLTHQKVAHLLTPQLTSDLDRLVMIDAGLGKTRLTWLNERIVEATAAAVNATTERLRYLRALDAHNLDLSMLSAERRRFLASVGRRSTDRRWSGGSRSVATRSCWP